MKMKPPQLQAGGNFFSIRLSFLEAEKGLSRKPLHWAADDM